MQKVKDVTATGIPTGGPSQVDVKQFNNVLFLHLQSPDFSLHAVYFFLLLFVVK